MGVNRHYNRMVVGICNGCCGTDGLTICTYLLSRYVMIYSRESFSIDVFQFWIYLTFAGSKLFALQGMFMLILGFYLVPYWLLPRDIIIVVCKGTEPLIKKVSFVAYGLKRA